MVTMTNTNRDSELLPSLSPADSTFLNRLKGASIMIVVLGHLGLGWIFVPYSSYIGVVVPVLFFCSGYIFIHLYAKKTTHFSFLIIRLFSVVFPFYLIYLIATTIALLANISPSNLSVEHFLRVIFLAPKYDEMPFPLGQVWYLRVLFFCAIACPLIYALFFKIKHNALLLIPVALALILSIAQTITPIHRSFAYFGHNGFQEIAYGAYFFIGSYIASIPWRARKKAILLALTPSILTPTILVYFFGFDTDLAKHAYAPDIFYFLIGVAGILVCLYLIDYLELIFSKIAFLGSLLDYCGNNSYGIFLLHTFLIVFVEIQWGWIDVINNPLLAFYKVTFVTAVSLLLAYPFTIITKSANSLLKISMRRFNAQ